MAAPSKAEIRRWIRREREALRDLDRLLDGDEDTIAAWEGPEVEYPQDDSDPAFAPPGALESALNRCAAEIDTVGSEIQDLVEARVAGETYP